MGHSRLSETRSTTFEICEPDMMTHAARCDLVLARQGMLVLERLVCELGASIMFQSDLSRHGLCHEPRFSLWVQGFGSALSPSHR